MEILTRKLPNEKMKALLAELKANHDLDGFLFKCAEWTVEVLEYFVFKPMPLKTEEVIKHEQIPQEDRIRLVPEYYDTKPGVRSYYLLVNLIQGENRVLYDWLKQCEKILREHGDTAKADQVRAKLDTVMVEQIWTTAPIKTEA